MSRLALSFRSLLLLAMLLAHGAFARAEHWPQWRGPKNDGISNEKNLPVSWGEKDGKTTGVLWKLPMPGPAGATPVVWGDKLFTTSAAPGGDLVLLCVSTAGKELWKHKIGGGDKEVRGDEGNSASPSPCTDGKHVWTFMANGELACYTVDGQKVWQFNTETRYKKLSIAFGMTSTPVLDEGKLYLQLLHSNEALVVCLEAATGKELWKTQRPSDAKAECLHSYASPVMYDDGKNKFLITHGCDYVVAYDIKNGSELWRCGGLNLPSKYNPTLRFVASPVAVPGLIVVPSAKNGPVIALRPDITGDVTNNTSAQYWTRAQNTPDVPSPVVSDGLVYLCRENGVLICMDAKSGEEIYQERCFSDRYRASPVVADGKVYLASRKGVVTVVKAGRTFEKLSENTIDDAISSSLAFSNGRIYIRGFAHLYCIGSK